MDKTQLVEIFITGENRTITAEKNQCLLNILRDNGCYVPAICAGNGTCGKCRVVVDGKIQLACQIMVQENLTVTTMRETAETFAILDTNSAGVVAENLNVISIDDCFSIAVDIGTTTVVVQLVNLKTGRVVASNSFVNAQRRFGGDVISRIKSAGEGNLDAMSYIIAQDIVKSILNVLHDVQISPKQIVKMMISCNTTMAYLLLALNPQSLGKVPFLPDYELQSSYEFKRVFRSNLLSCRVEIVPWISAFVGGDITSGIIFCQAMGEENFLLIDIGTNGEMALCTKDGVMCTSTAAGPAFEGGNISCGIGGIMGAISKVDYVDKTFACETIGGKNAIGICGSGVLDCGAALLQGGLIDDSGLLEDEYFDDGILLAGGNAPIIFTQKDVRELQLAKAAIRAGIEILLHEQGITANEVDKVYLAGGFGQNLRVQSAVAIGMIPKLLEQKVVACGNTSLGGCVSLSVDGTQQNAVRNITMHAKEINLAAHPLFNNLFMDYMTFEPA